MDTIESFFTAWGKKDTSGIKVLINNRIENFLFDRVSLSSGMYKCDDTTHPNYVNGALIPNLPWREPFQIERDYLLGKLSDYNSPSSYVAIVKFEQEPCDNILLAYGKAMDGLISKEDYNKVAKDFLMSTECRSEISYTEDVILAGLANKQSGLITVTEDPKLDKFIGLHLDSWENLPLTERVHSANRVCINLSTEKRYLLFINLTLWEMKTILNLSDDLLPSHVGSKFMNEFPNYPVVRIAINPYEAYIAPTENMIHDGSTLGMNTNSLCYTYRGLFKYKA